MTKIIIQNSKLYMQNHSNEEFSQSNLIVLYNEDSEIKPLISILDESGLIYNLQKFESYDVKMLHRSLNLVLIAYTPNLNEIKTMISKVKITANDLETYVFFSANLSDQEMIIKAFESGADDFMLFPYNKPTLVTRIKNHIKLINFRNEWVKEKAHYEVLNNEKNEILAIAAHDLKNPIFSIQLLGKTIRDDLQLTRDELYEFSNDIVESCDRIIDIIKQLLDLNSIESGKINVNLFNQSIVEPVKHLIELYRFKADSKNIKLEYSFEGDGYAYTDLNSLKNILDNFISNAIKYSPFDRKVTIRIYDKDGKMFAEVSDQGPGIPDAERDKLFKRFSKISNKPTGGENSTGLGLSIVKKFSELINADINFYNNESGIGSTFSVTLPKS